MSDIINTEGDEGPRTVSDGLNVGDSEPGTVSDGLNMGD
jgi:hypothetical protein